MKAGSQGGVRHMKIRRTWRKRGLKCCRWHVWFTGIKLPGPPQQRCRHQSQCGSRVVAGGAARPLAVLTDHPTGLIRIIPYRLHLWVDRAVGVVFVIAPFAFKFFGLDAWYYWVLAAAVLLTTSVFNAPEEPVAMRSGLDRRTAG